MSSLACVIDSSFIPTLTLIKVYIDNLLERLIARVQVSGGIMGDITLDA